MAFAAVISLKKTLQQIPFHPQRYSIPCEKKHIESFHEKPEFLQRFLEEYPSHKSNEKVTSLERRIRDAAYEAEDFMDLHLNNLCDSEETMGKINIELMILKEVDSVIEKLTKIKEQMGLEIKQGRGSFMEDFCKYEDFELRNALRKDSAKLFWSQIENLMVGFGDRSMQIDDLLTGQFFAFNVIEARDSLSRLVTAFDDYTENFYLYEKEMTRQIDIHLMIKVDSVIEELTEIKEQMGLEIKLGRGSSIMEGEIKIGNFCSHEDFELWNGLRKDSEKLVWSHMENLMVGFNKRKRIDDLLTGQSSVFKVIEARDSLMRLVAAFDNYTNKLYSYYKKKMMRQIDIHLMMKKVDSIIEEVTKVKEQMGSEIKQGRGSFMEEEIKIGEFSNHDDFEPRNVLSKDSSKLVSSDTKNLMVGFDDHFLQIKDQLTGQSSTLKVISIVGMGGIGKTTLATHVYNDPSLVYKFDVRAWVTVSQSYSVRDILLVMLDSIKILTKEMHGERDEKLRHHVYQNLMHRRYLIIIDDIWDTNAWDYLKMMFPDDKTGSRIMLTTRIADVAVYASPSGTLHQIYLLSDDQSWKLLCAKIFGDKPCPLSLQETGKTIAHHCRDCRGLPLSIVVIGGLLSKVEKTQMAWQPIAENVTSFVFSSDDQCSDMLRLSYNYLPQYLKACFLYMAVFPRSQEILVSKLTEMWAAEGFLRQTDGHSPEEVAEMCVEDLLGRSLILMSKKNYQGKIKAFRIHDLLLDFCVKEAKDEKFLQITESPTNLVATSSASDRRISIHRVEEFKHRRFHFDSVSSTSYVRSLVSLGQWPNFSDLFLRFKLLKVLDATEVVWSQFPSQVLELLNLRYIALSCDGDIPPSITKLWSLQTLIILKKWLRRVERYLPAEIWMMSHLRHVRCDEAHINPIAAKNHLVLKDLQTLSGLRNLIFDEEMLQSIPNIKKIDVYYDSHCLLEKKWLDNQLENLHNLLQLKALKIHVIPVTFDDSNWPPEIFKFRFPPSLKTLTLDGVGIPWDDLAIIGLLPNLEVLKPKDLACRGTEWEPNEGEFCKLKVLVLHNLDLESWRADSNHFPSLERLSIRGCDELVEIPSGMGESTTLTTIELFGFNDSIMASANEILEKQRSYGNDDFQVIHAIPKPKYRKIRRAQKSRFSSF